MIPKETNCAYVRISNLKQRMTEDEAATLDRLVQGKRVKFPGGASINGGLWNKYIRPIMLGEKEEDNGLEDLEKTGEISRILEVAPLSTIIAALSLRGYDVTIHKSASKK